MIRKKLSATPADIRLILFFCVLAVAFFIISANTIIDGTSYLEGHFDDFDADIHSSANGCTNKAAI